MCVVVVQVCPCVWEWECVCVLAIVRAHLFLHNTHARTRSMAVIPVSSPSLISLPLSYLSVSLKGKKGFSFNLLFCLFLLFLCKLPAHGECTLG